MTARPLSAPQELALALSASLRVMQVIEPLARLYGAGEMPLNFPEIDASIYTDTERTVIQRVARLSSRLEAEGTLHSGRPAEVLVGLSETVDLLVIGSRGYGPLKVRPPRRRVRAGHSLRGLPRGRHPTRSRLG